MALVIDNLCVASGGTDVVSKVSLSVEPGNVTAILGANGAGKSELVLGVAGMLPVTGGTIHVDGQHLHGSRCDVMRRAGVCVVPEGHRVLTKLSVDDNLQAAGASLKAGDVLAMTQEVYALFPELAERQMQLAGTMSGGQQQMLAIGHALMARPKYLLIDEMSLGLAPLIVKRLVSAISELVAQGTGVVLVEQFREIALSLASNVTVMKMGRSLYSGPVDKVRRDNSILEQAYF